MQIFQIFEVFMQGSSAVKVMYFFLMVIEVSYTGFPVLFRINVLVFLVLQKLHVLVFIKVFFCLFVTDLILRLMD